MVFSLVGDRGLAYNSRLAVASLGRRPPLAVLLASKTSLRASRPHATQTVVLLIFLVGDRGLEPLTFTMSM